MSTAPVSAVDLSGLFQHVNISGQQVGTSAPSERSLVGPSGTPEPSGPSEPRFSFLPGRRSRLAPSNLPLYPAGEDGGEPVKAPAWKIGPRVKVGDQGRAGITMDPVARTARAQERYQAMVNKEESILKRSACSKTTIGSMRVALWQLDEGRLESYLERSGTFDEKAQHLTSCLVDAIIYPQEYGGSPNRLRRWLRELVEIGTESGNINSKVYVGYGPRHSFTSDRSGLFVLKIATGESGADHEAIVGFLAVNSLRSLVPNFVYTYGHMSCPRRETDPQDPTISPIRQWCSLYPGDGEDPTSFVIIENVIGAVSATKFCRTCSSSDFVTMYIETVNALYIAYQQYEFTHYDLHADNVLVQTFPHNVATPCYHPQRQGYFVSHIVPRILDYGFSHIRVRGQSFGAVSSDRTMKWSKGFPMHDAYKFLCFCARRSLQNPEVFREQERIWTFFEWAFGQVGLMSPGPLRSRVANRVAGDFFVPPEQLRVITHEQLLTFLLDTYPRILSPSPDNAMLSHCGPSSPQTPVTTPCLTWSEYMTTFFNQNIRPSSVQDVFLSLQGLAILPATGARAQATKQYRTQVTEWLKKNTDLSFLVNYELPRKNLMISKAIARIREFERIPPQAPPSISSYSTPQGSVSSTVMASQAQPLPQTRTPVQERSVIPMQLGSVLSRAPLPMELASLPPLLQPESPGSLPSETGTLSPRSVRLTNEEIDERYGTIEDTQGIVKDIQDWMGEVRTVSRELGLPLSPETEKNLQNLLDDIRTFDGEILRVTNDLKDVRVIPSSQGTRRT